MFNLARVTRSSTSTQITSLKNNISQLAKQFDPENDKTNITNDRKFWLLENNHLSKMLKERDNTIKSLKRISRQRSICESEGIKTDRSEIKKHSNKRSTPQLQKQIQRLNKVISKLNDKCQRLQLTIKYQQQQIQIFENQNQNKKIQASQNVLQSKQRYYQMSQQMKNKLNSTRFTGYGSSSSKNSLGCDTRIDKFNQNQDQDNNNDFQFKQSITYQINSLSDNKNDKIKENKQIKFLKSEVNNLKEMMINMNNCKINQFKFQQLSLRKLNKQKLKYQEKRQTKDVLFQQRCNQLQLQKFIEDKKRLRSVQSVQNN